MRESIFFDNDDLIYGTMYEPTQVEPEAFTKNMLKLVGYLNRQEDRKTIQLDDAEEMLIWARSNL